MVENEDPAAFVRQLLLTEDAAVEFLERTSDRTVAGFSDLLRR